MASAAPLSFLFPHPGQSAASSARRAPPHAAGHPSRLALRHVAADPQPEIASHVTPATAVTHRAALADGISAEIIRTSGSARLESRLKSRRHVLIAYEQGRRHAGETVVDGLPPSSLRDFQRRLTFIPAGREFLELHEPGVDISAIHFHLDPGALPEAALRAGGADALAARIHVENPALLATALKIKAALEQPEAGGRSYCEALSRVLAHELLGLGAPSTAQPSRGGLAAWQERRAKAYIEEHIAEPISLATMAELVRLSPYHFCRAFKRSFGVPPHRYHALRRIARAKELLLNHDESVTRIALEVGFSETSSFSAAFRKIAGVTPTEFKRAEGNIPEIMRMSTTECFARGR